MNLLMIPVNEPLMSFREEALLRECIKTGWISSDGPFVKKFEDSFARYIGVKHGIAVSNGTAALEIAVSSLDLQPGDEIILPTFTIISCVLAILRNGLIPVLVDSDSNSWNMDLNQVIDKMSEKTKAIMPVHIYGNPVDMDPLLEIRDKYGIVILEDAAEAHGAIYKGQKCGSFGDLSSFSFYANKIVTTGEGGMVVTDRDDLADRLRFLRNLCFETGKRFVHNYLGFNFRITNLQAAVGVAQMEKVDQLVQRKREQGQEYRRRLKKIPGIRLQEICDGTHPVYWMNGFVLDDGISLDANELAQKLSQKGIQTRPFFWPMHKQPVFQKMGLFKDEHYPVSEKLARRGLYLPSGMALSAEQLEKVCNVLRKILNEVVF